MRLTQSSKATHFCRPQLTITSLVFIFCAVGMSGADTTTGLVTQRL
jgi:hypothetical protein